jgi:hypothetical protein
MRKDLMGKEFRVEKIWCGKKLKINKLVGKKLVGKQAGGEKSW